MTRVILSLNSDVPFGVNVLRNDCGAALAIANATRGQFIRCNVLSGAMVTDQGIIEGRAADVVRYRMNLHADVSIFADVHVKHAAPLKGSCIAGTARDTVHRGLADAVIVTGSETGAPPSLQDLEVVKKAVPDTFLFAGSGCTPENVEPLLEYADGCIVGKGFKKHGKMENPVDTKRVAAFMEVIETLR